MGAPFLVAAAGRGSCAAFLAVLACGWAVQPPAAVAREPGPAPTFDHSAIHHPAVGRLGMVVSQDGHATRVGHSVLAAGGNAFDAAAAVGFALAVTLPRAGNLGGGGFLLAHEAESGRTVAYDFREVAPALATAELFLGDDGEPSSDKSPRSWLGVGVPGSPAGLLRVLGDLGTMPRDEVLAPAVALAREGIVVGFDLAASLSYYADSLGGDDASRRVFYRPDGSPLAEGERLVQEDLARTLGRIAAVGRDGFYQGPTAAAIVAAMEAHGGLVRASDLARYEVVVREPLTTTYRGYSVRTMPPPSAGGVIVVQVLNGLGTVEFGELGHGSAASLHLLAELSKRGFADRGTYLGDPGFVDVPVAALTGKPYAAGRVAEIDLGRATPPDSAVAGELAEGRETTHFSVVDRWGNAAACTYTLNHSYGARKMVPGTGVLLNNELDDFVAKAGASDSFGMVAGAKNLPAPGKRPLSSMCPTIVTRDGGVVLVTGSPGGSHIPSAVLQILTNVIDFGMNVAEATAAPRAHHQWRPDELRVERGFSPDTLALLRRMGHPVEVRPAMGSTQSVQVVDGIAYGAADPRRPGSLALGLSREP